MIRDISTYVVTHYIDPNNHPRELLYETCDCGYILPNGSEPHSDACGWVRAQALYEKLLLLKKNNI